jgi:hypothetical protein
MLPTDGNGRGLLLVMPNVDFTGSPKASPVQDRVGQPVFGRLVGEHDGLSGYCGLSRRVAAHVHRSPPQAQAAGGGGTQTDGALAAEGRTARDDLCAVAVAQNKWFPGHWWPATRTGRRDSSRRTVVEN